MKKLHYEENERTTHQQQGSTTTCSKIKIKICPDVFSIFMTELMFAQLSPHGTLLGS
jgi:hypothetical protein